MAMGHGDIELDVSGVVNACKVAYDSVDHHMRRALRKAAVEVANSAHREHGYQDRTGALSNSIAAGDVTGGTELSVEVVADAAYAAAIEHGAKPHDIRPKNGKTLRFGTISGVVFAKVVHHPGNKPFEFLSGALEREFPDLLVIHENALTDAFEAAGFEVE